MNEKEYFKKMIHDCAANDALVKAKAKLQTKRTAAWRKPLAIAAASLAVLVGTVFLIPSARAEVFSWFHIDTKDQYLAADPAERTPIPELDAIIATPAPSQRLSVSYADEPYWREIGEQFSARITAAFFDGERLYISFDFDGVSGYPIAEQDFGYTAKAGSPVRLLLGSRIDPAHVGAYLEDSVSTAPYENGEVEMWEGPQNRLILTTEDGSQFYGWLSQTYRRTDTAFMDSLHKQFGSDLSRLSAEQMESYQQQMWDHYRENGLCALFYLFPANEFIPGHSNLPTDKKTIFDYTDENGKLRFHVRYQSRSDVGADAPVTKLDVDFGTVEVDMQAYRETEKRALLAETEGIALSGEAVFYGVHTEENGRIVKKNYIADLDGTFIRIVDAGWINALGVRDLRLQLTLPAHWSTEQREMFLQSFSLSVSLNHESPIFYHPVYSPNDDGSYTLELKDIENIPFSQIPGASEIYLLPSLTVMTDVDVYRILPDGSERRDPSVFLDPRAGHVGVSNNTHRIVYYPEWAITLKVQ